MFSHRILSQLEQQPLQPPCLLLVCLNVQRSDGLPMKRTDQVDESMYLPKHCSSSAEQRQELDVLILALSLMTAATPDPVTTGIAGPRVHAT